MTKLRTKKEVNRLALLFSITYMVSYITRINYGAVISQMVIDTGISKSLLSLALTGSFITYGIGQIFSGILGDKRSPKKLVSAGLCATVLMNLLIPICTSPYQMLVVWCINGLAQAFMWPPLVLLMTAYLSDEDYKKVTVKVSWGSSLGTIVVYLIAPALIVIGGWKLIFFVSALLGFIMAVFWQIFAKDITKQDRLSLTADASSKTSNKGSIKIFLSPLIIGLMIGIILQGMLRDGVTTWMPSYITETYHLKNIISILTGVLLPIFGMLSFEVASVLYRKKLNNPLLCAGVLFAVGSLSALILWGFNGRSAMLSVLFSALLTGCMHGVNLMLICMTPPYFKKYGAVSTVSGVLNSCTYIGSAISTYGIAVLSDKLGWNFTLIIWLAIAAAGALICFLCTKPWQRKFEK